MISRRRARVAILLSVAVLAAPRAWPASAQGPLPDVLQWSIEFRHPPAVGELDSPTALAVGAGGEVYVADGEDGRVQELGASGGFLRSWGDLGADEGRFRQPSGVAIDRRDGSVFVLDRGNQRVQVFGPD